MKITFELEDWEAQIFNDLAVMVARSRQNVGTAMKDKASSAARIFDGKIRPKIEEGRKAKQWPAQGK